MFGFLQYYIFLYFFLFDKLIIDFTKFLYILGDIYFSKFYTIFFIFFNIINRTFFYSFIYNYKRLPWLIIYWFTVLFIGKHFFAILNIFWLFYNPYWPPLNNLIIFYPMWHIFYSLVSLVYIYYIKFYCKRRSRLV